jgi:predicted RNA-binding protein YlxR (DUF448 family)
VVQELRGEKIDIVQYDDDPARFVCNAIAPAEVSRVIIDAEGHRMELVVPDDKLSLAIGKKGQNVRLASQLTGWRIDIHSESKIYELERRAKEQIAAIPGVSGRAGRDPVQAGLALGQSELARALAEELAGVPGVGGSTAPRQDHRAAGAYVQGAQPPPRRHPARGRAPRPACRARQQLLEIPGIDEEVLPILAQANVHSPEDLIKAADRAQVANGHRHRHERPGQAAPARDLVPGRWQRGLTLIVNATSHQPTDGPNQPKDGPARTCVGCRTVAPQADLLRIAVAGTGWWRYVHRAAACLAAAGKGGLARAFKRDGSRRDRRRSVRGRAGW